MELYITLINGRKNIGNWGYNRTYKRPKTPVVTGFGAHFVGHWAQRLIVEIWCLEYLNLFNVIFYFLPW